MGRLIASKYKEVGLLGKGSQGIAYKVQHIELNTIFVLKALPAHLAEQPDRHARLAQRVGTLAQMQHWNIGRVLESGRDDTLGSPYILREYVTGQPLDEYIRGRGVLPLPEVLEITRQVARALDYAHRQTPPVVHCNIKPSNIVIEESSGRPVVLDFAVAGETDRTERVVTAAGTETGTCKYRPPEQLRYESLTGSADVYALGMVMYELYTGIPFFSGLSESDILDKVLTDIPEHRPYFARPTLPEFVALVTKSIAKSREKRYRSVAELMNDLEACWWGLEETRTVVVPQAQDGSSNVQQDRPAGEEHEGPLPRIAEEDGPQGDISSPTLKRDPATPVAQSGPPPHEIVLLTEVVTTVTREPPQSEAQQPHRDAEQDRPPADRERESQSALVKRPTSASFRRIRPAIVGVAGLILVGGIYLKLSNEHQPDADLEVSVPNSTLPMDTGQSRTTARQQPTAQEAEVPERELGTGSKQSTIPTLDSRQDYEEGTSSPPVPSLVLSQVIPDPANEVVIKEGENVTFSFTVVGEEGRTLRSTWYLDDIKAATTTEHRWMYQPGFTAGDGKRRTVRVSIAADNKTLREQQWQVVVVNVNQPPKISNFTPRSETVEIRPAGTQDFAIDAVDPDNGDQLSHFWLFDGKEVAAGKRWRFQAPTAEGTHAIESVVKDRAGAEARYAWKVIIGTSQARRRAR